MGNAGVVDQQIKLTETRVGFVDQKVNVCRAGDIAGDRQHPFGIIQFCGSVLQAAFVDVRQYQAVPGGEPMLGHGPTEAGGGAGDQDYAHGGSLWSPVASFKLQD